MSRPTHHTTATALSRSGTDRSGTGRPGTGSDAVPPRTVPESEQVVVCHRLSRHYGTGARRVVAVHEVSVQVTAGARVALTGSSGSGKSTLLHLMAGLDQPSAGRVDWPALGGTPAGRPGLIGVVFQGPSLMPDLTVIENVGLPLLFGDRSRPSAAEDRAVANQADQELTVEALERVGVAELRDKLPEELSGGQAQRVALARVLVTRPRVILADEPTGQLNLETGHHVVSVLLDAATELGAALVVATHDDRVAERLDEQWHMHDGRLVSTVPDRCTQDRAETTSPARDRGAGR